MRGFWILLVLYAGLASNAGAGETPSRERVVLGWVEYLQLQPTGWRMKAKLDSGARTSSIHAEDVERFQRDGEDWVRFTVEVDSDGDGKVRRERLERPLARDVRIKEHDGPSDRRAVVELSFCLAGREHSAQFSLADRGRFNYPVLLGRRFLGDVALVDPGATFIAPGGCARS